MFFWFQSWVEFLRGRGRQEKREEERGNVYEILVCMPVQVGGGAALIWRFELYLWKTGDFERGRRERGG